MASVVNTGTSSGSGSKQIPLLCTVCPESPRFSDVSHLLTHIASKGHLHHETQTKLKAHQDVAASQPKRKMKRVESDMVVKNEHEDFTPDFPMFPGFFQSEQDNEVQNDFFGSGDMMSLKGQIWPGMGKMDLANEDMKRTRNQRKPKSVIEKMRRTSEGIEPTQVVMTAEFEVERVKDVYDSSSPAPDQEETTPPKKTAKPRRKRGEPLAEISANIPRGGNRRLTRSNAGQDKSSKPLLAYSRTPSSDITPTLGQYKRSHDIFRDDDELTGTHPWADHIVLTLGPYSFELRRRIGLHQLNPIAHSNMASPTPAARDVPDRGFSARDLQRGRSQEQSFLSMNGHAGSFTHQDLSYALDGTSIYNSAPRFPFATNNHFNALGHDHFRLPPGHSAQQKFEDYSHTSAGEANSAANQFLDIPATNPLFSQDRLFLGSCGQPGPSASLSPLGFTSINRNPDTSHSMRQSQSAAGVKPEPQLCDVLDDANIDDEKESRYPVHGIWESQGSDNGIEIHENLQHDELDL
ncbi:uncharacterized protein TRIREDRAFT_58774 [Trichoderma reesei QM6a]|uniref:Predicted protein n=1 Tax=Hypocrea jecorina (strain QM6a) TaxID=431241 RepID=G0REB7_HYPJQ|nr:uncharacterized protein TRIREDRAFT_58774 [Trichoderma reesei QM6a]EGR50479.1 predicted protein [Trichoderma reesei QM6a]